MNLRDEVKVAFIGNSVMSQMRAAAEVMFEGTDATVAELLFEPVVRLGDEPGPLGHVPADVSAFLDQSEPDVVFMQVTQAEPVFRCVGDPDTARRCRVEGMRTLFRDRLENMMSSISQRWRPRIVWVTLSPEMTLAAATGELSVDTYTAADLAAWDLAREGVFGLVHVNDQVLTDGQYADIGGQRVQYRDIDGVHYCAHGGLAVITELFTAVDPTWTPPERDLVDELSTLADFDRRTWGSRTCDS